MAAPVDADAVGNAFLSYYYGMFESNRAGLVSLYQDQSMLTFMGEKFQGPAAIGQKLGALPFAGCKVTPSTTDFQPSVTGGVIVFVTGHILVRVTPDRVRGSSSGASAGATALALPHPRSSLPLHAPSPFFPRNTHTNPTDRGREPAPQVQPGVPPDARRQQLRGH